MAANNHRLIITGTGRAGTTFLVELLTELGLDTGYRPRNHTQDYFAHCNAGLEKKDFEEPGAPYVVKDPGLCNSLPAVLAQGRVVIDHAIIPVRNLKAAARSRERVGGNGDVPGGLLGTDDPSQQSAVLAERFHRLVETLVAHEIPHTFLHFPRFARDAAYTYAKLGFLLPGVTREQFIAAFERTARPELIHYFPEGQTAGDGAPAREFANASRRRRRRRRLWRALAAAVIFAAILGFSARKPDILRQLTAWFSASAQPSR